MAFFYEEGEEKKRSGVFMRHVNIGTIAEDEDGNGSYAPSRIFIDPTLTQEGEAAEAKATGDAINALAEQTNAALDELSETTETAINDLSDATEEAINSLAAIGVIENTESGEAVSISDSAAYKMQGLRLYGKSRQATTTGAQLLDVREGVSGNLSAVTATADGAGGLTLNGTLPEEAETADIYFVGSWNAQEVLFEEDTYTFSVDGLSSDEKVYIVNNQSVVTSSAGSCTATTPITGLFIRLKKGKTYSNLKIYPMLSASSSAQPWEPYTGGQPSPSPEYPQEIESVTNPTVVVAPKNLIDYEEWSKVIIQNGAGIWQDFGIVITSNEAGDAFTKYSPSQSQFYYKIDVIPGITYTISWEHTGSDGSVYIFPNGTQTNMVFIQTNHGSSLSYTAKEGDDFITFRVGVAAANATATYKNVMLSIDSDTTFVPYGGDVQTLTYPTPNGLPGIPVESGGNFTDAEGQEWICDEVDFGRGKYVQRVKSVDYDGSTDESWSTRTTNAGDAYRFAIIPGDVKPCEIAAIGTILCSRFQPIAANNMGTYGKNQGISIDDDSKIIFYCSLVNDTVENWRSWLSSNPITVLYELATPTETDLTPEQITAYAALTTYKPNTTITTDSDPAAGIGVDYIADTKAYIDNKFAQLAELSTVVNALIGADE